HLLRIAGQDAVCRGRNQESRRRENGMKKPFYMALALTGLLAVGAQAQPPAHHEGDGHDHSRETKKPSEETTLDYFWRKSDEAFHAGDYPRAIDLHKAIVALDPGDIESYSVAAWL